MPFWNTATNILSSTLDFVDARDLWPIEQPLWALGFVSTSSPVIISEFRNQGARDAINDGLFRVLMRSRF